MAAQVECRRCGVFVYYGPVLCQTCADHLTAQGEPSWSEITENATEEETAVMQDGFAEARAGFRLADNPYLEAMRYGAAWQAGWKQYQITKKEA